MTGQPTADQDEEVACVHCGRKLEECAFCDEQHCNAAICYECVVVEVRQSLPQPHRHGG
jgi:hypothetical protein